MELYRSEGMILDQEKFESQKEELGLAPNSSPGDVVRAHLAHSLEATGRNGIGISMDACGINTDFANEIFTEYQFEIGPQYGPNWRTV